MKKKFELRDMYLGERFDFIQIGGKTIFIDGDHHESLLKSNRAYADWYAMFEGALNNAYLLRPVSLDGRVWLVNFSEPTDSDINIAHDTNVRVLMVSRPGDIKWCDARWKWNAWYARQTFESHESDPPIHVDYQSEIWVPQSDDMQYVHDQAIVRSVRFTTEVRRTTTFSALGDKNTQYVAVPIISVPEWQLWGVDSFSSELRRVAQRLREGDM